MLQVVSQLKEFQAAEDNAAASAGSNSSSSSRQPVPTDGPLNGNWRLLWTTEAAVHKLVQGQLLGLPVRDIQQRVDLRYGHGIAMNCVGSQCSTDASCALCQHCGCARKAS